MPDQIINITLRAGDAPLGSISGQSTGLSANQINTGLSNDLIDDINISSQSVTRSSVDNQNFLGTAEVHNEAARSVTSTLAGIIALQSVANGILESKNGYDTASSILGVSSALIAATGPVGASISIALSIGVQPVFQGLSEITEKNRIARYRELMLGARISKR